MAARALRAPTSFRPGGAEDFCAETGDGAGELLGCFADDEFLAGDKGKGGVRGGLGVTDEIAVEDEGGAVESVEMDHGAPWLQVGYRRGGVVR